MIGVDEISKSIRSRDHLPARFVADATHAAVAMILTDGLEELEVCFIRRAEREGDPWSGQVAFPGGRADPCDIDAYSVAERETKEEVGLELMSEHRVGPLPIRPIERRDIRTSMTLSPFIYYLPQGAKENAMPQEDEEVASVFWVPMSHLFDAAMATDLQYPMAGSLTTFPGIRYEDHVIWGLTLRILGSFAEIIDRPLAVDY